MKLNQKVWVIVNKEIAQKISICKICDGTGELYNHKSEMIPCRDCEAIGHHFKGKIYEFSSVELKISAIVRHVYSSKTSAMKNKTQYWLELMNTNVARYASYSCWSYEDELFTSKYEADRFITKNFHKNYPENEIKRDDKYIVEERAWMIVDPYEIRKLRKDEE